MSALAALWQVVMADGEQQDAELRILNQTRLALGLSEGDSTTARDQALSE